MSKGAQTTVILDSIKLYAAREVQIVKAHIRTKVIMREAHTVSHSRIDYSRGSRPLSLPAPVTQTTLPVTS